MEQNYLILDKREEARSVLEELHSNFSTLAKVRTVQVYKVDKFQKLYFMDPPQVLDLPPMIPQSSKGIECRQIPEIIVQVKINWQKEHHRC